MLRRRPSALYGHVYSITYINVVHLFWIAMQNAITFMILLIVNISVFHLFLRTLLIPDWLFFIYSKSTDPCLRHYAAWTLLQKVWYIIWYPFFSCWHCKAVLMEWYLDPISNESYLMNNCIELHIFYETYSWWHHCRLGRKLSIAFQSYTKKRKSIVLIEYWL